MKHDNAEQLRDALEMEGFEATIRADYEGRYMYGKTTFAVTSDAPSLEAMYIAGQEDIGRPRVDDMGTGYVYY